MLSVQELYEGKSTRDKSQEVLLLSIINSLKILAYNYDLAILAGQIACD